MKRSRSGARPSTGGQKNVARAHVRYKYQLTCVTSEGELVQPTDEDMVYFNEHFPEIAKKLNDCAYNAGFEPGSWQESCYRLVDGLIKQKRAYWFRNPVDPQKEGLPDYFETLSKAGLEPMDLGTVKMRLMNNFYQDHTAFAAAVRLVFTNATTYNRAGTPPHEDASKLMAQFNRKYDQNFAPTSASLAGGGAAAAAGDDEYEDAAGGGSSSAAGGGASASGSAGGGAGGQPPPSAPPPGSDFSNNEDDDEWAGDAAAAAGEQPKAVISDEESDEEEDDDDAGDARRTEGGKAPQSATTEAGKRPTSGGKAPAGMDDETADSEAEMSDSALDSQMESGDEGQGEDGDVSEADMFGDEDDDDGFDFEQNGNGEESEAFAGDSEAEGAYGDGDGAESSMAEGDGEEGDDDDDDDDDEFI